MTDPKNSDPANHKPFTDEETERRIHEHIFNADDQISEDDIDHVRTNFDGDIAPQTYISTTDDDEPGN